MYLKQRDDDTSLGWGGHLQVQLHIAQKWDSGQASGDGKNAHRVCPKNSRLEGKSGAQHLLEAHQLLLNLENLHKGSSSAKARGFVLPPRSSRSQPIWK